MSYRPDGFRGLVGSAKRIDGGKAIVREIDPSEGEIIGLESVGGFDDIKQELLTVGGKARKEGLEYRILVYGIPGTGKSYLVKAFSAEVAKVAREEGKKSKILGINAGDLLRDATYGHGSRVIKNTLSVARGAAKKGEYVVVILDDIENYLQERESSGDSVQKATLNTLLGELGGSTYVRLDSDKGGFLLVFAITNLPHILDEAVIRRFGKVIEFGRPDEGARAEILRKIIDRTGEERLKEHVEYISKKTGGFTPSDLESLLSEVSIRAAKSSGISLRNIDVEIKLDKSTIDSVLDYFVPASLQKYLFYREPPDLKFEDYGGYAELKKEFKKTIEILSDPQAKEYNIRAERTALLHGAPGTGKSYFVECLAGEIGSYLLKLDPTIMSKWVGETERNLRELLYKGLEMSKEQPVVIYIDELDKFVAPDTSGVKSGMLSILYEFLDDVDKRDSQVFVIGTTNQPIPYEALTRNGRFRVYHMPLPGEDDKREIAEVHLERISRDKRNFELSEVADYLSKIRELYTPADIKTIISKASERAYFEKRAVTLEDFKHVSEEYRSPIDGERWLSMEQDAGG